MSPPLIDTNVFAGRWPFRRLPLDEPTELNAALRDAGVVQAWVGSFDALLHRDIDGVNGRLAGLCRRTDAERLIPVGTVHPRLPDWEEDLRRCHEGYQMPGIRVFPGWHQYPVNDPAFVRLLRLATERGLFVQLVVQMEDPRTQHPLVPVPSVDLAPLPDVVRAVPGLRLQLLNAFTGLRPDLLLKLVGAGRVCFELATLEGAGGVRALLQQIAPERVLFGSLSPLFTFASAALKLREAGLTEAETAALSAGHARRFAARP